MLFNIDDLSIELNSEVATDALKVIADKIDPEKITLKWNPPKANASNSGAKKSQSIVKYYPMGEIFGLGHSRAGKLLIRNVKSSFVNSPAKFGSEQ